MQEPPAPPHAGPPPPLRGSRRRPGSPGSTRAPRPPSEDRLRSGRREVGSPRPPFPPRRGYVYCAQPSPPTAAASPRAAPRRRRPQAARAERPERRPAAPSARWLSATLFPGCGRGREGAVGRRVRTLGGGRRPQPPGECLGSGDSPPLPRLFLLLRLCAAPPLLGEHISDVL